MTVNAITDTKKGRTGIAPTYLHTTHIFTGYVCFIYYYTFLVLYLLITSDKGGGKCFCPRLSVCLIARLLKNACMDLDEMLRVDRCRDMDELINF